MALCLALTAALAACGAPVEEPPAETEAEVEAEDRIPEAEALLPEHVDIDAEDTRRSLRIVMPAYSGNSAAWWASFEETFEAENEDLDLVLSTAPTDKIEADLARTVGSGMAPDIVGIHNYARYALEGQLMSTGRYSGAELEVKFFEGLWEAGCLVGQSWGIPLAVSVRGFYYNRDIFEKAGIDTPPATFEELREACRLIRETCGEDVRPLGLDFTGYEGDVTFSAFTGSTGGFLDAEGNFALNTPANARALDFLGELVRAGYTNENPAKQKRTALQAAFARGEVAMMLAPPSLPAYVAAQGSGIRCGLAAVPAAEGDTSRAPAACDCLVIFKDRKEPDGQARNEAISRFLTAFYDDEVYADYVKTEGFLPATFTSAARMAETDFGVDSWISLLSSCRCSPDHLTGWEKVRTGVIKAEWTVAEQGNAAGQLAALQAEINQLLADAG